MRREQNVLVIAPDAELRRSITFLLEAEGIDVTSRATIPPVIRISRPRRLCAIVDEEATQIGQDVWGRLHRLAGCVVVLLSRTLDPPSHILIQTVEKPLLGQDLVRAVRTAFVANSSTST